MGSQQSIYDRPTVVQIPSLQMRSEQQRIKEEGEKKLQRYIRQLDHFERARRDEEAPLIEAGHKEQVHLSVSKAFNAALLSSAICNGLRLAVERQGNQPHWLSLKHVFSPLLPD